MTTLIDRTTGQPVEVEAANVQAAFQSGRYGFPKGQRIGITDKSGNALTIDPSEAQKAFSSGASFLSDEEIQKIKDEKEYGGLGGAAIGAAEGAVRGATLGLSDPILTGATEILAGEHTADQVRTHLRKYKETNPTASLVGELAGSIVPIVATEGAAAPVAEGAEITRSLGLGARLGEAASATARTVGAPTRALARAGDLVEKGVASVLGESSSSAVARIAKEALARGSADAVQGAIMGAGNQLSEDALGNHELAADKMLASIGHGMLFAGLVGGALGAGGEAVKLGIEKSSPTLKKFSEIQAVRSLTAGTGLEPKKYMQQLERIPGGTAGVGEELLRSKLVRLGDDVQAIAPRVRAAAEEAGAKRGALIREIDASGLARPDIEGVEKKFRGWLDKEYGAFRNTEASTFKAGETLLADLRASTGGSTPTLEQLFDWRRQLDDKINWAKKNPWAPENATLEAKKELRSILESEIKEAGDEAAKKIGRDGFLAEYENAGLRYRRLISAADMADDAVTRLAKNQMFGLGEKMMAAAAFGGSLVGGEEDIGKHGALGVVGGLASALAMKKLRAHGNATAAVFLDKIASLSAVRKIIDRADTRISDDVTRFIERKPSKNPQLKTANKAERDRSYETAVRVVRAAANDIEGAVDAAESHTGSIAAYAPKIVSAFHQGAARATVFLASKIPQAPVPLHLQPHLAPKESASIPPHEKEKFLRFVRAVNDPLSVVSDLTRGHVTSEGIEALQTVYPKLFDDVRAKLEDHLADPSSKPLSYDQKYIMWKYFGVAPDKTFTRDFIQRMQGNFADESQTGNTPPQSPPPSAPIDPHIVDSTRLGGFGGRSL